MGIAAIRREAPKLDRRVKVWVRGGPLNTFGNPTVSAVVVRWADVDVGARFTLGGQDQTIVSTTRVTLRWEPVLETGRVQVNLDPTVADDATGTNDDTLSEESRREIGRRRYMEFSLA